MSNLFCALQGIYATEGPDNGSYHVPYDENWNKIPFVLADQGDVTTGFVWDGSNYRYICPVPSQDSKVVLYITLSFDMFVYRLNKPIGPYRWGAEGLRSRDLEWGNSVRPFPNLTLRASLYQHRESESPVDTIFYPVTNSLEQGDFNFGYSYTTYSSRMSGQLTGFIVPEYTDGSPRFLEFFVKLRQAADPTQDESLYYIGPNTECTILPIVGV